MMRTIRFFPALFVCSSLLLAADLRPQAAFVIDPAQTTVEFTLPSTLHTIHGTFHLTRGDLRLDPTTGKATGELAVDATSGDSGSAARDKRMNHSILEGPQFPEIIFRPDLVQGTIAPQGKSQVQLHGTFTLHGQGHEMTLPIAVEAHDGQYTATASFSIPYIKWGLKNPSTLFLRVNDTVEVAIHMVAHVSPAVAAIVAAPGLSH